MFYKSHISFPVLFLICAGLLIFNAIAQTGNTYYVSTSGDDTNIGTIEEPWRTVEESVEKLQPGDMLYLRDGVYYEGKIYMSVSGNESNWITIKNYPGEKAVIDGGYQEFRNIANNDWELYDAEKNIYRSVNTYTEEGNAEGYLGADNGGFHLVPYEDYNHLSANNEVFSIEGDGYADGWIYIGPGVFRDADNRIYIRLVPGQEEIAMGYNVPNSTDPRQVQMFIFPKGSKQRLLYFLDEASFIHIEGIEMRYRSRILEFARGVHNITIKDCDILGGQYHILVREETSDLIFDGISINDSVPPWIAWYDVKSGRKPAHSFQQAGISIQDDAHDIEIKNSTFRNVFDGIDAIGPIYNLHIHDNLFKGTRDDAITIGTSAYNVEVNNNKIIDSHVAISYAGTGSTVQPGTKYIHHNVIDVSTSMLIWRDDPNNVGNQKIVGDDGMGWRKPFGSHAGSGYGNGDPWKIYNNTIIGGRDYDYGGVSPHRYAKDDDNTTGQYHEVYNNIFFQICDGRLSRGAEIDDEWQIYDGNLYFRNITDPNPTYNLFYVWTNSTTSKNFNSLAEFKADSFFIETQTHYSPGWENSGIEADPQLDENYRPAPNGPAATGAIDLAGKGWPGVDGSSYRGALSPIEDANPPTRSNPDKFSLQQNYPNPFNPSTTIKYSVAKPCNVQIIIYNQLGQEVYVLVNERNPAGEHNVRWNGKDAKGNKVASGIYYYRLTAGNQVETKKMLYLR